MEKLTGLNLNEVQEERAAKRKRTDAKPGLILTEDSQHEDEMDLLTFTPKGQVIAAPSQVVWAEPHPEEFHHKWAVNDDTDSYTVLGDNMQPKHLWSSCEQRLQFRRKNCGRHGHLT